MLTETQLREQSERQSNEVFGAWLNRPETRLIMSQIPAGDNKETLSVLLRSAFDAGVGCGFGQFAGHLLESMIKKKGD